MNTQENTITQKDQDFLEFLRRIKRPPREDVDDQFTILIEDSLIIKPLCLRNIQQSQRQQDREALQQHLIEVLVRTGAVECPDPRNTIHQIGILSGCTKEIIPKPHSPLLSTGKFNRVNQYALALETYAYANPHLTFHTLVITKGGRVTKDNLIERFIELKDYCSRLSERPWMQSDEVKPLFYAIHIKAEMSPEEEVSYHPHAHYVIATPSERSRFRGSKVAWRVTYDIGGTARAESMDDEFERYLNYLSNSTSGLDELPDEEIFFLHEELKRKHMFQALGPLKKILAKNAKKGLRFVRRIDGRIRRVRINKRERRTNTERKDPCRRNAVIRLVSPKFTEAGFSEPVILVKNLVGGLQSILDENSKLKQLRNKIIDKKRDKISNWMREMIEQYS